MTNQEIRTAITELADDATDSLERIEGEWGASRSFEDLCDAGDEEALVITRVRQMLAPGGELDVLLTSNEASADTQPTTRSIDERLAEYAKATRGLVPELKSILALTPEVGIVVSSHTALNDTIRLYGLFADDLDKIVRGEELNPFRIEATL